MSSIAEGDFPYKTIVRHLMYESPTIPELLEEWLEWALDPGGDSPGYMEFLAVVEEEPEKGWLAILATLQDERHEPHLGAVAAGPLEDLLCHHGSEFIDRVEIEAMANAKLICMLNLLYKSTICTAVWERVQTICDQNRRGSNA